MLGLASLPASERQTTLADLNAITLTISLDGADIFALQEELNRQIKGVFVNLEFDQRDSTGITLHASAIPLPRLLDDICRTFHSKWTLDGVNHSINIFPADTKRYDYYPFEEVIPSLELLDQTKHEVFNRLLGSPLLKDKPFSIVYDFSLNAYRHDLKLHGTLGKMTLRQSLNWLCANSGGRHCWRLVYTKDRFAAFYFIPKIVAEHSSGPPK